ncbi:hypothetical protein GGF46_004635, partial [Coemansia sp. RSA 552]
MPVLSAFGEPDHVAPLIPHSVVSGIDSDDDDDSVREADLEPASVLMPASIVGEARVLAVSALPIILATTSQLLVLIPLMAAVGGLGTVALASMNLVSIYSGVLGVAPLSGLAMALDSMCSQAFTAAKDKRLLGLYLQRVLVVAPVILALVYPVWWNSRRVFEAVGIPSDIAHTTGDMLRLYFFGVAAMLLYEFLKSFLFAQGIRRVAIINMPICLPGVWFAIWLFISNDSTSIGILGVPAVILVAGISFVLATTVFISCVDGHQCWGGWSRAAFADLGPLVRLGMSGSAVAFFEMISLHLIDLGALFLDPASMAAQAILAMILSGTAYMGTGFAVAACNRIGNLLGLGLPNRARLTVVTMIGIATTVFVPMCTALIAGRHRVAALFSDDPEILEILVAHIPWAAASSASQGISTAVSGVLRGQGRQSLIARIRIASFLGITLPLCVLFVVGFGWGLAGLWCGYMAGSMFSA